MEKAKRVRSGAGLPIELSIRALFITQNIQLKGYSNFQKCFLFKDHLLSHLPPHLELIERVLDRGALKGVEKAIKIKNLEWTPTTNATR